MNNNHCNSLNHLFVQVAKLHHYRTFTLLQDIEIYPGQPPLLFALWKENGQSQKELAQKLNIKPATITVMLNRMEKSRLVERRPDPGDQRVSRVYLTEKGRNAHNEAIKIWHTVEEECFGNFSEGQRALLSDLLLKMRDNLTKACGDGCKIL